MRTRVMVSAALAVLGLSIPGAVSCAAAASGAPPAPAASGGEEANAPGSSGGAGGGASASRPTVRVLLIAGSAGKEFQYLRNALQRQEEYALSVWQQNAEAGTNQSASSEGMKLDALPRTLEGLTGVSGDANRPGYHVVILCDPQFIEGSFDKAFVEQVLQPFVRRHGGGLCYVVGRKYTGSDLVKHPSLAGLRDMLPVVVTPDKDAEADANTLFDTAPSAWQAKLPEGVNHPILMLGRSPVESNSVWSVLPGTYWAQAVYAPMPRATVLAVSPSMVRRAGDKTDFLPILAVQSWGHGRVVYLGIDETWRWMSVDDGATHSRFWGNVVRHLAGRDTSLAEITTGGSRFAVGDTVTIEVRAWDANCQPARMSAVSVEVADANTGGVLKRLTLPQAGAAPGRFKTIFVPDRAGNYRLTVSPDGAGPGAPGASVEIRVEPTRSEAPPARPESAVGTAGHQQALELDTAPPRRLP